MRFFSHLDQQLRLHMERNDPVLHGVKNVLGIPFYGYFSAHNKHPFFKIYVYKPFDISTICSLLLTGKLGTVHRHQPYESHIPYTLQFFIDFNLYGFGQIFFKKNEFFYRSESEMISKTCVNKKRLSDKKYSTSPVEIDVHCMHVLNPHDLDTSIITLENEDKNFVKSLENIWNKERKRRLEVYDKTEFTQLESQKRATQKMDEIQALLHEKLSQMVNSESQTSFNNDAKRTPPLPQMHFFDKSKDFRDNFVKKSNPNKKNEIQIDWMISQLPTQNDMFEKSTSEVIEHINWMRDGDDDDDDDDENENDEEELENKSESQDIINATQERRKEDDFRESEKKKEVLTEDLMKDEGEEIEIKESGKGIKRKRTSNENDEEIVNREVKKRKKYQNGMFVYYKMDTNKRKSFRHSLSPKTHEGPPSIGYIDRINFEDHKAIIRLFYRPNETYKAPKILHHNEIFISNFYEKVPLRNMLGECFIMNEEISDENKEKNYYHFCALQYCPIKKEFSSISNDLLENVFVKNKSSVVDDVKVPPKKGEIYIEEDEEDLFQSPKTSFEKKKNIEKQSPLFDYSPSERRFHEDEEDDEEKGIHFDDDDFAVPRRRISFGKIQMKEKREILPYPSEYQKDENELSEKDEETSLSPLLFSKESDSSLSSIEGKKDNNDSFDSDIDLLTYSDEHDIGKLTPSINNVHINLLTPPCISQIFQNTKNNENEMKLQKEKEKAPKKKKFDKYFEEDHLCIVTIEIFVQTRDKLYPDPSIDKVSIIFIHITQKRIENIPIHKRVILSLKDTLIKEKVNQYNVYTNEKDLLNAFITFILKTDPDILLGYEIQKESLGYIIERCIFLMKVNLVQKFSRIIKKTKKMLGFKVSEYGRKKSTGFFIEGRIVLNLWRILRKMLKLKCYKLHHVVDLLFDFQIPQYTHEILTTLYDKNPFFLHDHLLRRLDIVTRVTAHLGIVERIGEFAKIYGIEFELVPYRGSQYKIESLLFRLLKPRNFIAFSAQRSQVSQQNPNECLALVMEPQSGFYKNPVAVLDFQSLYPSVIIGHNICFSTCVGRLVLGKQRLGVIGNYEVQKKILKKLKDHIFISPNGVMFVKRHCRYGVLPKLLKEILECRVMIKRAMKQCKKDGDLFASNIFDYKQEGLKMIANTTYGYTAAGFSGRMPCSDIADSIVQIGREMLEESIRYVERTYAKEGIRIIYGDTDSLFVEFPNMNKKDAFEMARKICYEITNLFPKPIKLKFEKMYKPCFMITKKRYVGNCYESEDQEEPFLDSKGIETIRRDNCGAVQKLLSDSLGLFFRNQDMNELKGFVQNEWKKVLSNEIHLKDYVFFKRVKFGEYSNNVRSTLPPAAIVARKRMLKDARSEPLYNQRIPYVVVYSNPHARLVDMVMDPVEYVEKTDQLSLHSTYYITKQMIPAFERIFGLIGNVNVKQWFDEMPKSTKRGWKLLHRSRDKKHYTIESYFERAICSICEKEKVKFIQKKGNNHFCENCLSDKQQIVFIVCQRNANLCKQRELLQKNCLKCNYFRMNMIKGNNITRKCVNVICDVLYDKEKVKLLLKSNDVLMVDINDW